MKKTQLGIFLGVIAGIIDVIPMVIMKLTWDANVSAFMFWIISGYLIATHDRFNGVKNGILISFLVLTPSAILIGWNDPLSLIPIIVMTLLLGSILGYLISKFGK
ncbi:hypothetical protein SDC9_137628 [bioreactor metagenome]|uniref:DUF1097 domain-containing protein n=1 Tax=bioreactor metagenome TaxID=1076179 RepID=A0A645DMH7_9ZZZZ